MNINLDINQEKLFDICQENDIKSLAVFGSFARGEQGPDSDVDLLVSFNKRISLLTLVKLEREFSEAIGRRVDLLTENSIHPLIRDNVLSNLQVIYNAPR